MSINPYESPQATSAAPHYLLLSAGTWSRTSVVGVTVTGVSVLGLLLFLVVGVGPMLPAYLETFGNGFFAASLAGLFVGPMIVAFSSYAKWKAHQSGQFADERAD